MKKHLWLSTAVLLILIMLLTGCGAVGFEEEKVAKEPINRDEWPTPIPAKAAASPTPFPKIKLPPTATPTPRPAVDNEQSTQVSPPAANTPAVAADMSSYIKAITEQFGILDSLPPVAAAFVTKDNTTIRQGPGESYGAVSTVESAELAGVLGQNPGGDWLYIITISAQQGWVPTEAMRVTGSLAEAPVLPPNPIEAALARAISAAGGGSSPASNSGPTQQSVAVADLKPVATAKVSSTSLNLRQRPGAEFKLLDTLPQGEEVSILALNRDQRWALVETAAQKQGWVSLDFLDVAGSLAGAPQVQTLTPDQTDQLAPMVALSGAPAVTASASRPAATTASSGAVPVSTQGNRPPESGSALTPVTTAKVNIKVDLRRGPGQEFGAVDTLTVDEPVTILARDESGDWAAVQATRSRLGWVPLTTLNLEGPVTSASQVVTAWVTSNEVDVKQGPGIFYQSAGKLAINDMVSVLATNPGRNWVLIQTVAGGLGWIQPRLLANFSTSLENLPQVESTPVVAEKPAVPQQAVVDLSDRGPGKMVLQLSSGGDIMVINPDGTGLRKLTQGIDPALSPDGQTVAFTRWQGETGSVWLVDIDGTNERQILGFTKQAKGPTWSPDGSQIAINYQQGGRLDSKDQCQKLAGGGVRPPGNASNVRFKLEPDSDGELVPSLCWTLPPDPFWNLRVINVADGSFDDLDGGTYAFRPTWDPANSWRLVSDGGRGLVEVDVNRNYNQAITDNTNDGSPVFSPDGRYLVVTAGHPGGGQGYDIYRLNADGSGRVRLTQTPLWETVQPEEKKPWNNVAPVWSPDASQIAFLTDRTERWEIWVMNLDGSGQRPLFSDEINDQLDVTYNFVDERVLSWQ